MLSDPIAAQKTSTSPLRTFLRRHSSASRWALRLFIALAISWLIAMAFFVTAVVSH